MKTSFLKNTAMAATLFAGLALTSCKDKDADADATDMDTTTTTTNTTTDSEMETTDSLDETGARDTISITTDTIRTVKP